MIEYVVTCTNACDAPCKNLINENDSANKNLFSIRSHPAAKAKSTERIVKPRTVDCLRVITTAYEYGS